MPRLNQFPNKDLKIVGIFGGEGFDSAGTGGQEEEPVPPGGRMELTYGTSAVKGGTAPGAMLNSMIFGATKSRRE